MFIPAGKKVGDFVRLKHDVKVIKGTFTKGHRFKIVSEADYRGEYGLKDEDGNTLYCGSENFE